MPSSAAAAYNGDTCPPDWLLLDHHTRSKYAVRVGFQYCVACNLLLDAGGCALPWPHTDTRAVRKVSATRCPHVGYGLHKAQEFSAQGSWWPRWERPRRRTTGFVASRTRGRVVRVTSQPVRCPPLTSSQAYIIRGIHWSQQAGNAVGKREEGSDTPPKVGDQRPTCKHRKRCSGRAGYRRKRGKGGYPSSA